MTRWKDTLPPMPYEPSLAKAASCIASAIEWKNPPGYYEGWAAAHIRAYRKTLDVKSKRCESLDEGMTPEELLWSAMSHLCYAGLFHDDDGPKWTAYQLRAAEADLRELWKRGQS